VTPFDPRTQQNFSFFKNNVKQNLMPVETLEDDNSIITEQLQTDKDETPTYLKKMKKNKDS